MLRIIATIAGLLLPGALADAQTVYPTGTTIWDKTRANNGYTIFAAPDGVCYLIDMDGTIANYWVSPVPGFVLSNVDPVSPGHITAFVHPPGQGIVQTIGEMDYSGAPIWSYSMPRGAPAGSIFHHDSERLANGNTLVLGSQPIVVPSISATTLQDDFILEVDPSGNVVWKWLTYEHAAEFGFDDEAKTLISAQGDDWAHTNSIQVLPPNNHTDPALKAGNILVSQRFTNILFIIEKSSGKIVWKIGPNDHVTFGQHDAQMIPLGLSGAGNILVFDNGSGTGYPLRKRAPGYSRIQQIDPVTKKTVWTYDARMSGQHEGDFFSNIVGGVQRLANGNTLICQGTRGRLFEVDQNGTIVWEYMAPFTEPGTGSHLVYRAYRVDYSWSK